MKIKLERVHFIPKDLKPGVLYVAEKFAAAAHLCACGCGAKIRTPLGPTEWSLEENSSGPTLYPSVGNWQQACQSHYIIYRGKIIWCKKWTAEQIATGRRVEENRRRAYYAAIDHQYSNSVRKVWHWIKSLW